MSDEEKRKQRTHRRRATIQTQKKATAVIRHTHTPPIRSPRQLLVCTGRRDYREGELRNSALEQRAHSLSHAFFFPLPWPMLWQYNVAGRTPHTHLLARHGAGPVSQGGKGVWRGKGADTRNSGTHIHSSCYCCFFNSYIYIYIYAHMYAYLFSFLLFTDIIVNNGVKTGILVENHKKQKYRLSLAM